MGNSIYAKPMTEAEIAEAKVKLRKVMDQDLLEIRYIQKRIQIEPKPEYVPPPPLIPIGRPEKFEYIPPFYQRAWVHLLIGLAIGILIGWLL